MENRKLYAPVRIPTFEEVAAHIAILEDVGFCDTPVAESCYAWNGISDGRRNTEKQVSVYDAMMAELHNDKARRAEKWRKTHDRCKKSKDDTPADRKRNKVNRLRKIYGLNAFEDTKFGRTIFIWDGKSGRKKFPEHEAEIFRNLKERSAEKAAYAELLPDPEWHVGTTTITGMMHRLWKIMMEIQEPHEQHGCDCFERYYYEYDGDIRHRCYYAPEYYDVLDDYEVLRRWSDVLEAQKRGVTIPDMTPEDADYFCVIGKNTFKRLSKRFGEEDQWVDEGWVDWFEYVEKIRDETMESAEELSDYLWEYSINQMGQEEDWYD